MLKVTYTEVQRTDQVIDRVNCSRCSEPLRLVFPIDSPEGQYKGSSLQREGAVEIRLDGGYGMYFDDDPKYSMLCATCAKKLEEQWPELFE